MGKYIDLLCTHCHYKVFAAISGGGFYFNSSSYSCFNCKTVTNITSLTREVNKRKEVYHEIKCTNCGNNDLKTLHKWETDNKPCPICKTQLVKDPDSNRFMMLD